MPEIIIVDLEATCDADQRIPRTAMEIIEIGAVCVDLNTLEIVESFQSYVRPTITPRLTAFCTELTGITQAHARRYRVRARQAQPRDRTHLQLG